MADKPQSGFRWAIGSFIAFLAAGAGLAVILGLFNRPELVLVDFAVTGAHKSSDTVGLRANESKTLYRSKEPGELSAGCSRYEGSQIRVFIRRPDPKYGEWVDAGCSRVEASYTDARCCFTKHK